MKLSDFIKKLISGIDYYTNPDLNTVKVNIVRRDDHDCVVAIKSVPIRYVKTTNIETQQFEICIEEKEMLLSTWKGNG